MSRGRRIVYRGPPISTEKCKVKRDQEREFE